MNTAILTDDIVELMAERDRLYAALAEQAALASAYADSEARRGQLALALGEALDERERLYAALAARSPAVA